MHIAVILVNYNGLSDTIDCLNSIGEQTLPIQAIVVDNASKENEALIIQKQFPKVKTIRSNNNLGFAGGNNVGIQWALNNNFEYIALLNNDTILDCQLFEYLLNEVEENAIVAPYMYYHSNPQHLWYGGGEINRWTGNAKHFYTNKNKQHPFECSFITGCCFMAHRNIWGKIGLLDESYFMYNEDTDYSIRLLQKKVKIKIVPQAKLWHKVGKSSGGKKSALSIYYTTRNRLQIVKKYKSFFKATAYPFSVITRYLWIFLMKLKGKNEWRAFYRGIKDAQKGITGASFKG